MKNKFLNRILDIAIGFLCVVCVAAAVFAVKEFRYSYDYSYDAESFYYRLEDGDFAQMVEMYHTNEAAGAEADEELSQYYGVAKYFEAASYYNIYESENDTYCMRSLFGLPGRDRADLGIKEKAKRGKANGKTDC